MKIRPHPAADVKIIQQLLNQHPMLAHATPLRIDGSMGSKTIAKIEAFQREIVKIAHPDGRIDPDGRTILALLKISISSGNNTITYELSAQGKGLLESIEQLRLKPYDDQTGKEITFWVKGATIGYGHLISQREWNTYKNGINKTQAEDLFAQDLMPYANAVKAKVTSPISQNQFDALVILVFNIGIGAFSRSSVLKIVNNPTVRTTYPNLEAAWKAWSKSQGKVMRGLLNRRNSEWDIYSQNVYKKW